MKTFSVYKSYSEMCAAPAPVLIPPVALTGAPKFHWFSFYDIPEFDPSGRYLLGMEVGFEGRKPKDDDEIAIGIIDLEHGRAWKEIGRTTAWCWQQGCRLQWRRGSRDEVLWNERQNGHYVCRIYNVKTGQSRTLPKAIYNVAPDGRTGLSYDFERVAFRGYGFDGIEDQRKDDIAPATTGIFQVDLDTGASRLIVTLSQIHALRRPDPYPDSTGNLYLMQLQWNPSGTRFLMYSRRSLTSSLGTVVFTANADGTDVRKVDRDLSHYEWADDHTLLFWKNHGEREGDCLHGGGYYLYPDNGRSECVRLWDAPNGHQTYLPGREWLLTDTYAQAGTNLQHLYLYHLPSKSFVPLARFDTPADIGMYSEFRCDLHPRLSLDGRRVVVDSFHGERGRQLYLLDIGHILDDPFWI